MAILRVGADKQFVNINSAYAVASNGDTIFIDEGTYVEQLNFKNKVVNLVGNTAYPAEGNVVITSPGTTHYPLTLEYAATNPEIDMYIEGIKLLSFSGTTLYSMIQLNGLTSTLNLIFNKCIIDALSGMPNGSTVVNNQYSTGYAVKSIMFKRCRVLWQTSNNSFCNAYFSQIPTRQIIESIISASTTDTYFNTTRKYKLVTDDLVYNYGPVYGNYETSISPTHCFSGTVDLNSSPVERTIDFFRRDNDVYVGSTVSSGISGEFYMETYSEALHNIVCFDDIASPDYSSLILSKRIPKELPYDQYFSLNTTNGQKWNPDTIGAGIVLSSGNKTIVNTSTNNWRSAAAFNLKFNGKWYFEVKIEGTTNNIFVGLGTPLSALTNYVGAYIYGWGYYGFNGSKYNSGATVYGTTCAVNDVVGVAVDIDAHKVWWSVNNVWQGAGNPSTGINPAFSNLSAPLSPMGSAYVVNTSLLTINAGSNECVYSPPTGFNYWQWIDTRI